jgi:hypothetical protein
MPSGLDDSNKPRYMYSYTTAEYRDVESPLKDYSVTIGNTVCTSVGNTLKVRVVEYV